jgi:DNA-binding MarR family transcriptional regulator
MSRSPLQPDNGNGALDPLIHEASRLLIVSVLNEGPWMDFGLLAETTGLTNGNLSAHMARLIAAEYVEEWKEFVDRKPRTSYRLTRRGRDAFRKYQQVWRRLTSGSRG